MARVGDSYLRIRVLLKREGWKNESKACLQDKKNALNALNVQIVAILQKIKVHIAAPLELITIEQTSA
jgi:hypothetical protein